MEHLQDALWLLKRQCEFAGLLRKPGGIRISEGHDLYAVRARLKRYPEAVAAVLQASATLHRPFDALSIDDVRRIA